ncbi:S41 family peptidase [Telmatospirillum sp. J64-1]|uniref:S41 family peptidase n=1 Tax=Telmatospirillum sp. J64-1 TaxID=2502183 RepID=UPI00115F500A|nr:S41 family peptidase [Telmatospirillum sp. J64-1]
MNRAFLIAASTTALLAFQTVSAPAVAANANNADTYRLLNLFGDVFERVRSEYVEEVTDQELIEAAINGMLTSLDPHSSYLDTRGFRDMQVQTKGEFGGLGIEVSMENGVVKVVSPIDDTPAFRAGIQPGDLITHLDGEQIMGLTLSDAVERMRGPVNTDIRLTIRRNGAEPFDVTLTRAIVRVQAVRHRVEGDIGYIRINTFNEHTEQGVRAAISDIRKQLNGKPAGYVLDLRNNPGGLLDQAIAVSDAFLERGEIVSTRSRREEDTQRFNARPGDLAEGLPIVVLINDGSASASEIVAGALQDHRRAIVLGTKSFGKGSVQTIIPLPGQGAMRLTTARYYTPSGRSIQAVGIEPDILVQQARIETLANDRRSEADLRGALMNEQNNGQTTVPPSPAPLQGEGEPQSQVVPEGEATPGEVARPGEDPSQDYQLARALDLLRGLALYQGHVTTTQNQTQQ